MDGDTLLVADYSSLEIGIAADLHARLFDDWKMVNAYADQAKGIDIHSNNAREVFGTWLQWRVPEGMPYGGELANAIPVDEVKKHPYGAILRNLIKAIFYGMAYGKGAYGFSTLIGADAKMIGEETAGRMVNALLDAVPGMRKWFAWVQEYVREYHGIYSLG